MSEQDEVVDQDTEATDTDAAADQGDDNSETTDSVVWEAKFKAQQRINRELERRTKKDATRLAALEGKKPTSEKKTDDDTLDVEKIRAEAVAEAQTAALKERVLDKIEAKAGKFVDPEDAAVLLLRGRDADEFIADGSIDVQAIVDALDELAENKPHLVSAQGVKRFGGTADQGPRKVKKLDLDDQIREAESKGDWKLSMSLKSQKAIANLKNA